MEVGQKERFVFQKVHSLVGKAAIQECKTF